MSEPDSFSAQLRVVYVEDDARIARLLSQYLASHGVAVSIAPDAREGLALVTREQPDVILLDVMLPGGMDGLELCRHLRERTAAPILMVTARQEEADRVMGLEGGADDYIIKPFSSRELLARIRAHARRVAGKVGPQAKILRVGRLTIDTGSMSVQLGESSLLLTTYEFLLLTALAESAGRVLTREQLVDRVRGSAEEAFDRSVDVHVSHLRQKLGDDSRQPRMLKTVRGVGYVLVADGS